MTFLFSTTLLSQIWLTQMEQWPGPSQFDTTDWIWQHVFAMDFRDDCTSLFLQEYTYAQVDTYLESVDEGIDVIDFAQGMFIAQHWSCCMRPVTPSPFRAWGHKRTTKLRLTEGAQLNIISKRTLFQGSRPMPSMGYCRPGPRSLPAWLYLLPSSLPL